MKNDPVDGEHHELKFRGTHTPPELWEMIFTGEISAKECLLLQLVDSLVGEEDCFASNRWLGVKLHIKEDMAKKLVCSLKDKGLLIQTGFNGRKRWMKAVWSRIDKTTPHSYRSDGEEITTLHGKKLPPEDTKRENTMSPPAIAGVATPIGGRFRRMAERLEATIATVKKVNCKSSISQWARSLELLHIKNGVDPKRMKKAMLWYCDKMPTYYGQQFFPDIQSGDSFRTKFIRGVVERAMTDPRWNPELSTDENGEPTEDAGPGADVKVTSTHSGKMMSDADWEKIVEEDL